MTEEVATQLAVRDRMRKRLALSKTPAQRMQEMSNLQESMWVTLRSSPQGYMHLLRRNFKARAISTSLNNVR